MSSVIVLCPNGHRVTVPVTPGTLINQIKQHACEKQNYCITKYGLKQELSKKFLDLSTPFRLSGLSNRAKLELVPQEQKAFEVNVAVQVEGSERKQGKFSCDELLINIIQKLFPGLTPDASTTMLYMQRQISAAQISSMTLRDLGITQSAMLRLRGVNVPMSSAAPAGNGGAVAGVTIGGVPVLTDPIVKKPKEDLTQVQQEPPTSEIRSSVDEMAEEMAEQLVQQIQSVRDSAPGLNDVMEVDETKPTVDSTTRVATDTTPLVFSPQSKEFSEVDDKFFNLNQRDMRSVLSDLNKIQNPQFKFRNRESTESQYQQTVIRVRFPCGRVLQSFYSPNAPASEVYDFVSSYTTSTNDLQLFSGPPKQLLPRDKTLHELGLEPTALIHAGGAELRGEVSTVSEEQARAQLSGSVFSAAAQRSEPIVMDTDAKPEPAPQKSTSGKSKAPPKWFKMN